jgi:hypothetical protein
MPPGADPMNQDSWIMSSVWFTRYQNALRRLKECPCEFHSKVAAVSQAEAVTWLAIEMVNQGRVQN